MKEPDHVTEMVGPPAAYFYEPSGRKVTYKCIAFCGSNGDEVKIYANKELAVVTRSLPKNGIIYWRVKPEFSFDGKETFRFYCRLETSPPLPKRVWDALTIHEECAKLVNIDV